MRHDLKRRVALLGVAGMLAGSMTWVNDMSYTAWHKEGGQGSLPKVVKFQIRPDPLAK